MILIPAVDLLKGQVVRLYKGDMDDVTVYSKDPVDTAKQFIDMGVTRLHIVDLDGAKAAEPVNFRIIEKIASLGHLSIEVGGGIRNIDRAATYFNCGVTYAILGTVAVKDPHEVFRILSKYPGHVILGVDARSGMAATEGWYENSEISATDIVLKYKEYNVESVIYTDIDKDGTLSGLNMEELIQMADISPFPIIASGGIGSEKDLDGLRNLSHPNIKGCIIGKAFYEGKIDLKKEIEQAASTK